MSSFDKIHIIFEVLRKNQKTGLTNKEICDHLKMAPSTSYRILSQLRKYGYIHQRKTDTRYFLGFNLLRLAESVVEGMDIAAVCLPFLEDLHYQTEETTFFALRSGNHCVTMEICGQINTRIYEGRGEIMPMYCAASGKVVLAFLSDRERERIIGEMDFKSFTSHTESDPESLREELREIRSCGVAYNHQGLHEGFSAVAAPVFGSNGIPLGSIALVGSSVDLDQEQLEEYAELLVEACTNITYRLGGTMPEWVENYGKKQ